MSKHNYILWIKNKRTEAEKFKWQILKKKDVLDVLVDLEEAFFNDLMRESSQKHLHTKVTPDFHLTYSKDRG